MGYKNNNDLICEFHQSIVCLDSQAWLLDGKHTVACDCEDYYFQCNEGSPSELYSEVVHTGWLWLTHVCTKSAATYSCNSFSLCQDSPQIK